MAQIIEVKESNLPEAGSIHSESWKESHRSFCTPEFVEKHTPQAQTEYLRREMEVGKRLWMLIEDRPVGIVSVWGSLIENLYILPEKQNRGYGTKLLRFAVEQCEETPTLWILNNNEAARRLYERNGFTETGRVHPLKGELCELELARTRLAAIRQAEADSHTEAYTKNDLYTPGSWLAKPVKTVEELLPRFDGYEEFRALDLGCGVGRNAIAVARSVASIPSRVDCVDILPMAIEKLKTNAERYGVGRIIHGAVSSIDGYEIRKNAYDLILAVSALEHVDCGETFRRKLAEIREGIRPGGFACLIVNSGVTERDQETGTVRPPQFEVNLPTEQMERLLAETFTGWEVLKHTLVHQRYDIPRGGWTADLETDVVTWVVRREIKNG